MNTTTNTRGVYHAAHVKAVARALQTDDAAHYAADAAHMLEDYAAALEAALSAEPAASLNEPSGNSGELAQGEAVAWAQFEEGQLVALAFKRSQEAGCTTPLYTAPPAQPAERVPVSIEAAIAHIQKKADDYAEENCDVEWDTGATVYRYGQAGEDYHHELLELVDELTQLTASPAPSEGGKGVEG